MTTEQENEPSPPALETPAMRTKMFRALIPVAAILAAVVTGLLLVKSKVPDPDAPHAVIEGDASPSTGEITVGSVIPDFSLKRFSPQASEMKEVGFKDIKGKVFLINFWATWCEACVVEMPSIVKLRKEYASKGLEVVAVSLDEDPGAALPQAMKELGMDFDVYTDQDSKFAEAFNVRAIPLTIIVDRKGKVLFIENGERDWAGDDIKAKIDGWLAG
jgi:thiol-disulfide isomerase/thioredoxin